MALQVAAEPEMAALLSGFIYSSEGLPLLCTSHLKAPSVILRADLDKTCADADVQFGCPSTPAHKNGTHGI